MTAILTTCLFYRGDQPFHRILIKFLCYAKDIKEEGIVLFFR